MEENIHILLIEDNPADARLIDIYLSESHSGNFTLSLANRLSDGLDILLTRNFDAIILDLSLPDSTGLDTFIKVLETNPETAIIVLTGLDDESLGKKAVKLGAQDFLIKGEIGSKGLSRSIDYSIERNKLHKRLSVYSRKMEEDAENLAAEKMKLSEAQKLAHIGSWEINDNLMTWSDEMHAIFGRQSPDPLSLLDFFLGHIHPEDRELLYNSFEMALRKHKPVDLNHKILRKDNSIRILHTKAEARGNKEKGTLRLIGSSQDITERMQEEYTQKLVHAATQSFNSVVIRDRNGRIEWVNEGFCKLSGFTLEDVIGSFGDVLKKGIEIDILVQKDYFQRVIKRKAPVTYEHRNFTQDGKSFWTITTLTPIVGKDGEVERIMSIDSDITLRKHMEEELLLANKKSEYSLMKGNEALSELKIAKKELEESMKVKELFLANMSHEIRTPMNAIVGFTNLLIKANLPAELNEYIRAIQTSGENLLVIINDILDFSKIKSGKISFEETELDLTRLMNTMLLLLQPKATEKNILLSFRMDAGIPKNLLGDPTRLLQIMLNLVGNAIKFTNEGEVCIEIGITSLSEKTTELKFLVKDTGIGIAENKLAGIFDGFSQAETNTTRKYGGTGLGLSISKQLVELQKGSISVESAEGKGTSFSVQLSFKINRNKADLPNMKIEQAVPLPAENFSGLKVLLVEDNTLNQLLATKVLSDWQLKVVIAENGLIALTKLQEDDYDLVLMDIQLPEMDGYEATRTIRKMAVGKSRVPIIAMTAHALAGEEQKCLNAGMTSYISKPFDPDVLFLKITEALNQAKASGRRGTGTR
jgi:PAS domain S-box-containing protein